GMGKKSNAPGRCNIVSELHLPGRWSAHHLDNDSFEIVLVFLGQIPCLKCAITTNRCDDETRICRFLVFFVHQGAACQKKSAKNHAYSGNVAMVEHLCLTSRISPCDLRTAPKSLTGTRF